MKLINNNINPYEILKKASLQLKAIESPTREQKAWLALYALLVEQLKSPIIKEQPENIPLAVNSLLKQYSDMKGEAVKLTLKTFQAGDSILYQKTKNDEIQAGVVSVVEGKYLTVKLNENLTEKLLIGGEFIILDKCITVTI